MHILLVEDHKDVARPVIMMLEHDRHQVRWASTARAALDLMAEAEPDLLILDIMLPDGENAGLQLAKQLREAGFERPILFLTARDAIEDRIEGLDLGGDDYLTKPFDVQELLARVRALLRRDGSNRSRVFLREPLKVDLKLRRVWWDGQEKQLSEKEFALLEVLVLDSEKVFFSEALADRLFPDAETPLQSLRMYVMRLRDKLGPQVIVTVSGGYRLGLS
ncbi:response regulator transcription factor [Deinococcus misasensis]|uniref:response regulator transcription factor n=1 Tax=Deinococcus misasensis TaxID=392413 RepID=UPI000559080D|nr:response regulator transcription factor [Deinococcus misasensis]